MLMIINICTLKLIRGCAAAMEFSKQHHLIDLVIGFLSAVLGFLLSPQFRFSSNLLSDVEYVSERAIILGVSFWVASLINGRDYIMLMKSKVDFVVNLVISSFIGCMGAFMWFFCLKYEYVGRWVFIISSIAFSIAVLSKGVLYLWCGRGGVCIIGENVSKFSTLADEIGFRKWEAVYNCVGDSVMSVSRLNMRVDPSSCLRLYIVPGSNSDLFDSFAQEEWRKSWIKFVLNIDLVIERELGVTCLDSLKGQKWWGIPTRLRMTSFVYVKRIMDLVFAGVLFVLSAPVLLISFLAVRCLDGKGVLYRQVRLGQYGEPFVIYKIRTMRVDSEPNGAQWAKLNDARVTRLGRILRRSRIDELPQIWNIINGDMSLVGPRPERPEFYTIMKNDLPEFQLRLACKPGLTGWAQVNYPYGASLHDSKVKLLYDIYYIKNANAVFDARILTRTVLAMVKGAR
jgi:lipopolysaccharide/colanic/teichoic acid biosynthesis glycosyltransferase